MTLDAAIVILAFYVVCALIIFFFLWFYKLVNQPRFRDGEGDATTEAGYEEDGIGNVISTPEDDNEISTALPHTEMSANMESGPF